MTDMLYLYTFGDSRGGGVEPNKTTTKRPGFLYVYFLSHAGCLTIFTIYIQYVGRQKSGVEGGFQIMGKYCIVG
jgi:hypothetical protein